MKLFTLPDLGEGLPDAIIREWHVNVGDSIKADQSMVSMETAKALVDVPVPFDGKVEKLFGAVGDTIETGQPLIGFVGDDEIESDTSASDAGTVVGAIEQSNQTLRESATGVITSSSSIKATPAVRALAKRLDVDLSTLTPSGTRITASEVRQAAATKADTTTTNRPLADGMTKLSLTQQAMAAAMNQSHREVVPVTLSDEADISAWHGKANITLRIIRAIQHACVAEPMLNATFDSQHLAYRYNEQIHLGIAIDTRHGLYVPVLRDIANQSDQQLRHQIDQFKQQAQTKTIAQDDLHGSTIIFSNFGTIAGRYANPVLLPPMTAIVGAGKLYQGVVAVNQQAEIHPLLPLSITVDHRAVTGGQLARFIQAMITHLTTT